MHPTWRRQTPQLQMRSPGWSRGLRVNCFNVAHNGLHSAGRVRRHDVASYVYINIYIYFICNSYIGKKPNIHARWIHFTFFLLSLYNGFICIFGNRKLQQDLIVHCWLHGIRVYGYFITAVRLIFSMLPSGAGGVRNAARWYYYVAAGGQKNNRRRVRCCLRYILHEQFSSEIEHRK